MYWYWLVNIKGLGRKIQSSLIKDFRTPENIFYMKEDVIEQYIKSEDIRRIFLESRDMMKVAQSYEKLEKQGIRFLCYEDESYPKRLKNIPDPPLGLYLKGNLPEENRVTLAIIGTRDCSSYGRELATYFGKELAGCGVNIVSGLARGIDGYSHRGALLGGGYTLGVIGGGIDKIYPKENKSLFCEMEKKGGILSESNMGVMPYAFLFPERNRIISGLADGILVVEAMEKSGTFITVDQGLEQGKDIFAIPGRITDKKSMGCNNLIKLGANVITDVSDVLDFYHIAPKSDVKSNLCSVKEDVLGKMSLAPPEKMVYSCLRIEPKYLDDILCEVKMEPGEVCMALNHLVLSGFVVESERNYYGIKIV